MDDDGIRNTDKYREGYADFQAAYRVTDKVPDVPVLVRNERLQYLTGWLDARTKARLGGHIVDWC